MKIIKLHKIAFNSTSEIFVNPTQIGNFERGNNSTWLCLRNGYYCDVKETPEEILQLIKETK